MKLKAKFEFRNIWNKNTIIHSSARVKGIVYQHLGEFTFSLRLPSCHSTLGKGCGCHAELLWSLVVQKLCEQVDISWVGREVAGALVTWKPANVQKYWQISSDLVVKHHWDTCSHLSALAFLPFPSARSGFSWLPLWYAWFSELCSIILLRTLEHLMGAKGLLRSVKGQTDCFSNCPKCHTVFCAVLSKVLRIDSVFVPNRGEIQLLPSV